MKTIYVAEDGTQFEYKYQCEDYERELKEKEYDESGKIILFSISGKKLSCSLENLDSCFYVHIKEDIKDEYILDMLDTYSVPHEKGIYYFDSVVSDTWVNLKNYASTLRQELKIHEEILEQCAD